jgi:hypothetical protein
VRRRKLQLRETYNHDCTVTAQPFLIPTVPTSMFLPLHMSTAHLYPTTPQWAKEDMISEWLEPRDREKELKGSKPSQKRDGREQNGHDEEGDRRESEERPKEKW